MKTCFGPFSARLSVDGVYLNLQKETDHLHMILRDEVDRCVWKRIIRKQYDNFEISLEFVHGKLYFVQVSSDHS